METRKEKNKCKKCGALIERHDFCKICSIKENNQIAIQNKYEGDFDRTVNFYKLKLINYFQFHNVVIMSFIKKYAYIADRVIEETRHMGFRQDKRYIEVERKTPNPPHLTLEYIKAPLRLISGVRAWKRDIETGVVGRDD